LAAILVALVTPVSSFTWCTFCTIACTACVSTTFAAATNTPVIRVASYTARNITGGPLIACASTALAVVAVAAT